MGFPPSLPCSCCDDASARGCAPPCWPGGVPPASWFEGPVPNGVICGSPGAAGAELVESVPSLAGAARFREAAASSWLDHTRQSSWTSIGQVAEAQMASCSCRARRSPVRSSSCARSWARMHSSLSCARTRAAQRRSSVAEPMPAMKRFLRAGQPVQASSNHVQPIRADWATQLTRRGSSPGQTHRLLFLHLGGRGCPGSANLAGSDASRSRERPAVSPTARAPVPQAHVAKLRTGSSTDCRRDGRRAPRGLRADAHGHRL
jgi:hypothetical protein